MSSIVESVSTIILAVLGLALVATLVSTKANTANVLQAGASALANNVGVAESPVTGSQPQFSLGYPSSNELTNTFGGAG